MALPSTYALQQSLPNRSLNTRPRALSLSEYQPLSFDREALESAYQQTLTLPAASSISSHSPNLSYNSSSGYHTTDPTQHSATTTSTLTHNLKRGDNPHSPILEEPSPNFAGVGAGHSLTPPSSPFHAPGKLHQSTILQPSPPTLPPRPIDVPESTFNPVNNGDSMDVNGVNGDGALSDAGSVGTIEMSANKRGKRRALPPVPTNVPIPEPPQWEPDLKSHIPAELTQSSVENAYAQLGAPPPGLPARRVQPRRQASLNSRSNYDARRGPVRQYSGNMGIHRQTSSNNINGSVNPATGSTSIQGLITEPNTIAAVPPMRPRPPIEKEVVLRSVEKTPIWSTHYLDPSLRTFGLPSSLNNAASLAFSGLSNGDRARNNGGAGSSMDGVAKAAKEWAVPPDGRFVSDAGGIELGLGVVDSGEQGWGKDKGRKRARVEVVSKTGGIRLDLIEVDQNRQIELRVESKSGDILVLLPDTFQGPIHITAPSNPPTFLSVLSPRLSPPTNPYASFYTTHLTPINPSDQVTNGFMSNTRGELSKVTVVSGKGRVVLGYRESRDEEEAKTLGLIVGAQGVRKRKRWWRGGA